MNVQEWLAAEAKKPRVPMEPREMTNRELAQLRFTFVGPEDSESVAEEIEYRRDNNLLIDDDYKRE